MSVEKWRNEVGCKEKRICNEYTIKQRWVRFHKGFVERKESEKVDLACPSMKEHVLT